MTLRTTALIFLGTVVLSLTLVNCGVKGKPLPPLEPAEIGRGTPTYKRAAEQAKPRTIPDSQGAAKPIASPTPERRGQ